MRLHFYPVPEPNQQVSRALPPPITEEPTQVDEAPPVPSPLLPTPPPLPQQDHQAPVINQQTEAVTENVHPMRTRAKSGIQKPNT